MLVRAAGNWSALERQAKRALEAAESVCESYGVDPAKINEIQAEASANPLCLS